MRREGVKGVKGVYGERGCEEEIREIGIVLIYKPMVEIILYPLSTLVFLCVKKKPTPYGIGLKLSLVSRL